MGTEHYAERPPHRVTVATFMISTHEVTQGEWRGVMGPSENPSYFKKCGDNCPVENVSYNDIQEFIDRINARTRVLGYPLGHFRLPTEAEWEYACQAGGRHEYCGSDNLDAVAWYHKNSGSRTHPVGGKQANAFGLYDMSGNVDEWTCSAFTDHGYDGSEQRCNDAKVMVTRGGNFVDQIKFSLRSTLRGKSDRDDRYSFFGFRLAHPL